jgi:alpha-aminoadipate/glutamate carrier protein LysW
MPEGRNDSMVSCPKCDAGIDVEEEDLDEGDVLSCDECGASLKVASLHPVELETEDDGKGDDDDFDFDDEDGDDDEEEEEEDEEWH